MKRSIVQRLLVAGLALLLVAAPASSQDAPKPRFVGLILVSHGQLAAELRRNAELVVGEQIMISTIAVDQDDDMEMKRQDILRAIKDVDGGCGVLIMTDMFGGTPSNLAISAMIVGEVEVLAGMNMPMVIKAISTRSNCDVNLVTRTAEAAGERYITIASELLRNTTKKEPKAAE